MLDPQISALLHELGYDPAIVESLIRWSIYLTIASVLAAIPTGVIAKRRGRSVAGWVIFALCVPVLPMLLVWLLPGKKPPAR
ncbi:MAG TPA: hypothetical protein VLV90_01880 [Burkholderiales bacterium]|nr:hypothetical protein [Burkholderiales bacterium]